MVNRVDATTWIITVHYSDEVPNPKVGINTLSPSQTMDVAGKLKLGDDMTAPIAGTIRWNQTTQDFEGYNGTEWLSFTKTANNKFIIENDSKTATDGTYNDLFGSSVSISGDYAIVGTPFKDVGGNPNQGKVYIFKRSGTSWTEQASIVAADGGTDDSFGRSVSISGDYAIVGTPFKDVGGNPNQGKVYIFNRSGTSWTEQASIVTADGGANDSFGWSVSISGDYAIVGTPYKDVGGNPNQGKVYIFIRNGSSWTEQASIVASDGTTGDIFGSSVAISGYYVIIGAMFKNVGANNYQGKAYIFKRSGTTWTEQADLVASDGAYNDNFSISVSISGDYAIVGAGNKNVGGITTQGKAYIYHRSGTNWTQQASIVASDGAADDKFGESVSISNNYAIVGAFGKDLGVSINQGKAYIFIRSGTSWTEQANIVASDGEAGSSFGLSVSISGDYIIVGARGKDVGVNTDQGKVYFFNKE
ncbi:MAG: FG-GAP repeat protein [Saprospiraceae bacterium]|nr:FG-GAP repeat protein [Saprospiraceae bacterium]